MAGWLVARWFFGGEMVGGEIPWWRDDRIPLVTPSIWWYSAVTPKRHLKSRTNILLTEVLFLDDTINNRSNNWLIGNVHSELVN